MTNSADLSTQMGKLCENLRSTPGRAEFPLKNSIPHCNQNIKLHILKRMRLSGIAAMFFDFPPSSWLLFFIFSVRQVLLLISLACAAPDILQKAFVSGKRAFGSRSAVRFSCSSGQPRIRRSERKEPPSEALLTY